VVFQLGGGMRVDGLETPEDFRAFGLIHLLKSCAQRRKDAENNSAKSF
jgi:hypothetical protein